MKTLFLTMLARSGHLAGWPIDQTQIPRRLRTLWMGCLLLVVALVLAGTGRMAQGATPASAKGNDFLEPDQAFAVQAHVQTDGTLTLNWRIAKGYNLYRDRLALTVDGRPVALAPWLPQAQTHFDANFNKEVAYYENALTIKGVPLAETGAAPNASQGLHAVQLSYQGCAASGFCYSPMSQQYPVQAKQTGLLKAVQAWPEAFTVLANPTTNGGAPAGQSASNVGALMTVATTAPAAAATAEPSQDQLARDTLQSGSVWKVAATFLLFGLLLSLTPCVLPMLPILSSIIVGQGVVSKSQGLVLALAYSLGMALVYTALGVGAGLAGEGLAAALQKPVVLFVFAGLLFLLALSMFDVYTLQLPAAWQAKMNNLNGKTQGGRLGGVLIMGALSALVVSPCVAAPLAGALLFISQTKNGWLGGWALFAMAMGMSVPLLLAGLSAGTLLPRAGAWMNQVKYLFGLLLVAVAIWTASPALAPSVVLALAGAWLLLSAVYLGLFDSWQRPPSTVQKFGRMLALVMAIGGGAEVVGAVSHATDVLNPLQAFQGGNVGNGQALSAPAGQQPAHVNFIKVKSVDQLDGILKTSKAPVLLDFYADWCTSCKEMERITFADSQVKNALSQITLLQADVTANTEHDKQLLKRFQLFGPPGMVLFNAGGEEVQGSKIMGYLAPEPFLAHLKSRFSL